MARNNDRKRISENYEPPFDAAGYKPGSPKMKRVEGSGPGVVGGERRQLKGGHGGTEQTHPKNKNRVNDKGVVAGSETSSSHGEASDGFQEKVGHDWPDGPTNDGASGEFATGYDYTGAAPEPKLEGWNPDSIGSMIGEEYNLQDMFNQYAGTRRSVNMLEFKNVCRANGFDYPLSEDMFRQLIENNKEFVFTEHHDGIHRFYISESDMGMGMGEEWTPADIDTKKYHKNPGHELYEKPAEKPEIPFDPANPSKLNPDDNPSNHGYGIGGEDEFEDESPEGNCGMGDGWGLGEDGTPLDPEDNPMTGTNFRENPRPEPARKDFSMTRPETPEAPFDPNDPSKLDPSKRPSTGEGWGYGGDEDGGCECTTDGGECKCPPFCKKCKPASGSCGSGKCGGGKKDDMAEGLQRKLTRFFTEARSIIKENARYGRRIIGAKLNESWDCNAGYCKITSSKQKVGQALNMLKNRYPSFNPLFENTQEVMKTGYMIDKAEGKKTEEGGKEPSMSDFKEVTAKGLNNRQPKNGLTGKPKEYPK